jgi:hypothetical protein
MSTIYLPNSARLLDYAATTKSSARKAGTTVLTIKIEVGDPHDAGWILGDLAEIDRKQRSPMKPASRGRTERELARELAASSAPLQITHRRGD